jgi:hypothetical protein
MFWQIYWGKGCSIAVSPEDSQLRYRYVGGTMEFSVPLYSEIGEPYKARFDALIRSYGLDIKRGVDLDHSPWCADVLNTYEHPFEA